MESACCGGQRLVAAARGWIHAAASQALDRRNRRSHKVHEIFARCEEIEGLVHGAKAR